jgi:integrase
MLRAQLAHRDAVLVSLMAYAGLRPWEARTLRWGHVQERTLVIGAPKTGWRRTVRLLDALAQDLREWRMASGRPGDDRPVIPRPSDGGELSAKSFKSGAATRSRPRSKPPIWTGRGRMTYVTASRRCCCTRVAA